MKYRLPCCQSDCSSFAALGVLPQTSQSSPIHSLAALCCVQVRRDAAEAMQLLQSTLADERALLQQERKATAAAQAAFNQERNTRLVAALAQSSVAFELTELRESYSALQSKLAAWAYERSLLEGKQAAWADERSAAESEQTRLLARIEELEGQLESERSRNEVREAGWGGPGVNHSRTPTIQLLQPGQEVRGQGEARGQDSVRVRLVEGIW